MSSISYQPLYLGVFLLQVVTVLTVALERLPRRIAVPFAVLACAALGAGMALGYAARRRAKPQWVQLVVPLAGAALIFWLWLGFFGARIVFVVLGLGLLVGRNAMLATRRALYFDLAIVLTIFYDSVGVEHSLRLWPYALGFLLVLVFVLMADYSDRRLAYVQAGDTQAREALMPGLQNAALATGLVLAVGLALFFVLPQPPAMLHGIPFGEASAGQYVGEAQAGKSDPTRKSGGPGSATGGRPTVKIDPRADILARLDVSSSSLPQARSGGPGSEGSNAESRTGPLVLLFAQVSRPVYLRTHAFVRPDGREWHESPGGYSRMSGPGIWGNWRSDGRDGVVQRFQVNGTLERHLPFAHRFDRVAFPTDSLDYSADLTLRAPTEIASGTRYNVRSVMQYVGERPNGGFETLPAPEAYLELPATGSGRLRELVSSLAQGRPTTAERAQAFEDYLRANCRLGSFEAGQGDAADAFLFEQRQGSSEQFASALALMLRTAGIASRVAAGYRARRLNPLHGAYEIWQSDRHYWVEAFIDDRWAIYEPSPWATLPGPQGAETAWRAAQDYVRLARVDDAGNEVLPPRRPPDGYLRGVLIWGWLITYGPWALAVLAAAAYLAWRQGALVRPLLDVVGRIALWRVRCAEPRRAVITAYRVTEGLFGRRGLRRSSGENHAEFLARAAAERPHLSAALGMLGVAFAEARYGRKAPSPKTAEHVRQQCLDMVSLIDELEPRRS